MHCKVCHYFIAFVVYFGAVGYCRIIGELKAESIIK